MNVETRRESPGRRRVWMLGVLALFATTFVVVTGDSVRAQDPDLTFGTPDTTVIVGDSVEVPIVIGTQTTGAGAIQTEFTYDTDALEFTECSADITYFRCHSPAAGTVHIAAVDGAEWDDDTQIGTISFSAKATDYDGTISMAQTVILAQDGSALTGEFEGLGALVVERGDVSCDQERSITDALFIAQMTVGNRTDLGTCPLPATGKLNIAAGDVNGDGATTIADALFIAQCEAFIPNDHC